MTTFEDIGRYLDKLQLEKKFDLMGKIVEDVLYPKITVNPDKVPTIAWKQCAPRVFYRCTQVYKSNAEDVAEWLRQNRRFDEVSVTDRGITTEYGEILWTDWIVLEPHDAVVFIDDNEFEKQYILNG